MQSQWLAPNGVTYNSLISACANDRAEQTMQFFKTMQSQWLATKVITYKSLISACAKGERARQALQLFEQWSRSGSRPMQRRDDAAERAHARL